MRDMPEGCRPIITPLGEQITELVAHLDAGQYQFLVLLGEFDEKQEWADEGIHSCAHWLNIYCGISMGAGRERVRVARALLRKALDLGVEQLFHEQENVSEDVEDQELASHPLDQPWSESFEARRADALERMASAFLSNKSSQACGGDAFLVNIHTDVDTLSSDGEGAQSEVDERVHVSAETSRRLSCDASVVHWLDTHKGEPLSIGRKSRTIPPAIRRALHRRDRGCRFPGCTCTRFVDAHHIHHWADGGETKMDNLVLLCRRHHRLVHEEGYGIKTAANRDFQFTLPDGRILPNNRHGRFRGNVSALKARNHDNCVEISPFTAVPKLDEGPMDHDLGVVTLIQRE